MTERASRDRCRLPAPSRCLDGRVATSVPTAARIAAADSGLPRGRQALSGALHTDAQACAAELAKRRLPSASLVPRPDSPPTASSDDSTRTTEPKTLRGRRRNHQQQKDQDLAKTDPLSTRPLRAPFYFSVPTPRSSLFIAPPHFQLLREPSRKGALPSRPLPSRRAGAERIVTWPKLREIHSPKMRPLLHMTFDPNRPSPHTKAREKQAGKSGGKIHAPSEFLWFPPHILGIPGSFCSAETASMSGEGCDLVCGEGDRQLA